jgi:NAD(P)-dependent dehydrogenase (short-subunit alcohol dehydrogenase family)
MTSNEPSVLITGACGGVGRALVKTFQAQGYRVIATDVVAPTEDLPYAHFIQADLQKTVTDENYATGIFKRIRDCLPNKKLQALVNNAAVQILAPCEQLNRADWSTTLNVNLLAPFFWTQAFIEHLARAKGSVVNISSIHAQLTKTRFVSYATSKAALSGLTRSLAVDLGNKIRINAIEPAAVRTEMLIKGFAGKAESLAELESFHPLGRIAETEEIANAAVFLCSEDASFFQGSIVSVSGGILGCLNDPEGKQR